MKPNQISIESGNESSKVNERDVSKNADSKLSTLQFESKNMKYSNLEKKEKNIIEENSFNEIKDTHDGIIIQNPLPNPKQNPNIKEHTNVYYKLARILLIPLIKENRSQKNVTKYQTHDQKPSLNLQKGCEYNLKNIYEEKKMKNFVEKKIFVIFLEKNNKSYYEQTISNLLSLILNYNNEVSATSLFSLIRKNKEESLSNCKESLEPEIIKEIVNLLLTTKENIPKKNEIYRPEKDKDIFKYIYDQINKKLPQFIKDNYPLYKLLIKNQENEELQKKFNEFENIIKDKDDQKKLFFYYCCCDYLYDKINENIDSKANDSFMKSKKEILNLWEQENFSKKTIEAKVDEFTSGNLCYEIKKKVEEKLSSFSPSEFKYMKFISLPLEIRNNEEDKNLNEFYKESFKKFREKKKIWKFIENKENFFNFIKEHNCKSKSLTVEIKQEFLKIDTMQTDTNTQLTKVSSSIENKTLNLYEKMNKIRRAHQWYAIISAFKEIEEELKVENDLSYKCFLYKYFSIQQELIESPKENQVDFLIKLSYEFENLRIVLEKSQNELNIYSKFMKDFCDILEKIYDGDLNCALFCKKLYFTEEYQFFNAHPIILGIISFYESLKNIKKKDNENQKYYDDNNLPKITFINFDGYDHALNYLLAKRFAKRLQIISITIDGDELCISNIENVVKESEKNRQKKHFHFLPLRSKIISQDIDHNISSKDLWQLFNKIVFKLISAFHPSSIIMSHSFIFYKTIKTAKNALNLNPKTFSKIIQRLNILSNYKTVLYPNITMQTDATSLFDSHHQQWKQKFSYENEEKLYDNRMYIYEMLGSYIFTMNGISEKNEKQESSIDYSKNEKQKQKEKRKQQKEIDVKEKQEKENENSNLKEKERKKIKEKETQLEKEKNDFYDYFKQLYNLRLKNKGLVCNFAWKFCEDPLQKNINEQIFGNKNCVNRFPEICNYSKHFENPSEKLDDELESENNSVFSNQILLYNQVSKKLETYLLNHVNKYQVDQKEIEETRSFYYSDNSVYFVHYEISKIFFFNVSFPRNKMNNYFFEFGDNLEVPSVLVDESKTLVSKQMKFYFDNSNDFDKPQYLTDFSVCATKETIYLFWGTIANEKADLTKKTESEEKTQPEKKLGINKDVYAYSIKENEWKKLVYKNKDFSLLCPLPISRIKASSCAIEKKNKDVIYVFGGSCLENCKYDIYNIIDKFEVKKNEKTNIYYTNIPKFQYKDSFKPTNNALSLFLHSTNNDSKKKEDKILLLGGTSSPYIYNQSTKLLSAYLIKIEKTKEKTLIIEIENCLKNLKVPNKAEISNLEGLNLIISSANKNYFNISEKKSDNKKFNKIIFIPSFFVNEKRGIFLDGNLQTQTKTFFTNKTQKQILSKVDIYLDGLQKFQKNLAYSISLKKILKNDLANMVLFDKKQSAVKFKLFIAQEFATLMEKIDKDFILVSDEKPELTLLKFKKTKKTNVNSFESSDFEINYIGYSFPDLKKSNYPYSDYFPSKIKTTNYSKLDDKIFILVNNATDNNHKRAVYELDFINFNYSNNMRVEPKRIFEDTFSVKGSTILGEYPSYIYLLGGELADMQKKIDLNNEFDLKALNYNAVYDIENNSKKYFENNLMEMLNPYAFLYEEFIICINRSLKGGSVLYGEIMDKNADGIKKWIPFIVDASAVLVIKENFERENDGKISIINLFSMGRVELNESEKAKKKNIEAFLLEYEQIKPYNERKKKIIFLSLKKLCQRKKNYFEKFYELKKNNYYQFDGDEGLHSVRDYDENESEEKKLLFFMSNLKVSSCSHMYDVAEKNNDRLGTEKI